jgi:hypothetical protein
MARMLTESLDKLFKEMLPFASLATNGYPDEFRDPPEGQCFYNEFLNLQS